MKRKLQCLTQSCLSKRRLPIDALKNIVDLEIVLKLSYFNKYFQKWYFFPKSNEQLIFYHCCGEDTRQCLSLFFSKKKKWKLGWLFVILENSKKEQCFVDWHRWPLSWLFPLYIVLWGYVRLLFILNYILDEFYL